MIDLFAGPVALTKALIDISSVSHHEEQLADQLAEALTKVAVQKQFQVDRHGNTLVARTNRGLGRRVILAGHIDTVPEAQNVPHHVETTAAGENLIYGLGAVDMKSGAACYLDAFVQYADHPDLQQDLTLVLYEGEEVASQYNGLGHLAKEHPDWLQGDFALLGEPSGAMIEAGCQGTIRLKIIAHGTRAHSARSWLGANAAHRLVPVMAKIASYQPRSVELDGCTYREGLNIVHLEAGVATNTIPDEAWLFVNFRFAPDRPLAEALSHLYQVLGLNSEEKPEFIEVVVDDAVPGAQPGLSHPVAQHLVTITGGNVRAKFGWTDVARFGELGIGAVNFGPGDPSLCHKPEEHCPESMIITVADVLRRYLLGQEACS